MITFKVHIVELFSDEYKICLEKGFVPFSVIERDRRGVNPGRTVVYFREQCGFATYADELKFNAEELKRKQDNCKHEKYKYEGNGGNICAPCTYKVCIECGKSFNLPPPIMR